jgi:hypothetical protein
VTAPVPELIIAEDAAYDLMPSPRRLPRIRIHLRRMHLGAEGIPRAYVADAVPAFFRVMMAGRLSFRVVLALLATACLAAPTRAFDLWRLQEVFTNSTGTIQFIELATTGAGEFDTNNTVITATSDGVPVSYTLNHNLAGQPSTANRTVLISTASFVGLTGAPAPDFGTLPQSFINPNAASITLSFAGVDSISFNSFILPKNGIGSLVDHDLGAFTQHLTAEQNSPRNFAGASGSVNLTPFLGADFDEMGSVNGVDLEFWKFGYPREMATHFDGDANGDAQVDGNDFLIWQRQLGMSQAVAASAAVPEPAAAVLAAILLAAATRRLRRAG